MCDMEKDINYLFSSFNVHQGAHTRMARKNTAARSAYGSKYWSRTCVRSPPCGVQDSHGEMSAGWCDT